MSGLFLPPPLTPPHKGEGDLRARDLASPLWGGGRAEAKRRGAAQPRPGNKERRAGGGVR